MPVLNNKFKYNVLMSVMFHFAFTACFVIADLFVLLGSRLGSAAAAARRSYLRCIAPRRHSARHEYARILGGFPRAPEVAQT